MLREAARKHNGRNPSGSTHLAASVSPSSIPSCWRINGKAPTRPQIGFITSIGVKLIKGYMPEKWGDSQVGFRGSNASGGRTVLLPGAFWAHGASKMAILGASLLLCILQCFAASEGMLPPGACRSSRASARRIVSCRALCASSLCPPIPHAPAPTFGVFRSKAI